MQQKYYLNNIQTIKAQELFHIFDKSDIGEMHINHLVNYFKTFDRRINFKWLQKLLRKDGIELKEYITQKDFIEIYTKIKMDAVEQQKIEVSKQQQFFRRQFSVVKNQRATQQQQKDA